jgi:hypothetical protein
MTKKDFFRILIKLFGLYSAVITVFQLIPNNFIYAVSVRSIEPFVILWTLLYAALSIAVFSLIIFKTDMILNLLKLDQGFDDEFMKFANLNDQTIVKIGIIIIGGFLFVDYFPDFIQHCYSGFKSQFGNKMFVDNSYSQKQSLNWALSGINVVMGYLLLTNFGKISSLILKVNKKNVQ